MTERLVELVLEPGSVLETAALVAELDLGYPWGFCFKKFVFGNDTLANNR